MPRKLVSVQHAVVAVATLASVVSGARFGLLVQKFTEGDGKSIRVVMPRFLVATPRLLQPVPVQRVWRKS